MAEITDNNVVVDYKETTIITLNLYLDFVINELSTLNTNQFNTVVLMTNSLLDKKAIAVEAEAAKAEVDIKITDLSAICLALADIFIAVKANPQLKPIVNKRFNEVRLKDNDKDLAANRLTLALSVYLMPILPLGQWVK